MAALPTDVRDALGTGSEPSDWVRLRSSPGSIVGETFLVFHDRTARVVTRASALADLVEIPLEGPPTFEPSDLDAAIVLPSGGATTRVTVGYLEREEVQALFERLADRERASAAIETAPSGSGPLEEERAGVRAELVAVLDRRLHALALVDVLRARVAARRRELSERRRRAPLPVPVEHPPDSGARRRTHAKVAKLKERRRASENTAERTSGSASTLRWVLVATGIALAVYLLLGRG